MALVQARRGVVRSGNVEHQHRGALVGELAGPSDESITDLLTWISRYIGDIDGAAAKVASTLQEGDLVITLGAGSVTRLSDEILEQLRGMNNGKH